MTAPRVRVRDGVSIGGTPNDDLSGQEGNIRLAKDGHYFVLLDGETVPLWFKACEVELL